MTKKLQFFGSVLTFFPFFLLLFGWSFFNGVFSHQEILIEERGGKPIRVIKVILDGEHFVVSSVADYGGETLTQLMQKVGGTSAINGAFFCPKDYTSCGGETFSRYERVFMGEGETYSMFRPDTSIRGIFGFEQNGTPLFVQNKISTHDLGLEKNLNSDKIDDLYFGISNFPILLMEGEDVTWGATNYIDNKMTGKANRNFICSTKDGKTVYLGVVGLIGIRDMAEYLKQNFDCYNALWLDAGASSAMIFDNKLLSQGSRTLITDAFVVVDRDHFLHQLGGKSPKNTKKYTPEYTLTKQDEQMKTFIHSLIDQIIKSQELTKTEVINMIRKAMPKLEMRKKAIFNQVLIDLFTIKNIE